MNYGVNYRPPLSVVATLCDDCGAGHVAAGVWPRAGTRACQSDSSTRTGAVSAPLVNLARSNFFR